MTSEATSEEIDEEFACKIENENCINRKCYHHENDPSAFWGHTQWHTYSTKSLFFLKKGNRIREIVVSVITHKRFDQFIILLIALNSILLGLRDYEDVNNETPVNNFIEMSDQVFVIFFTVECLLKIIGMGFIIEPGSYLREAWNWLDFIVVVSSLLTEIPQL